MTPYINNNLSEALNEIKMFFQYTVTGLNTSIIGYKRGVLYVEAHFLNKNNIRKQGTVYSNMKIYMSLHKMSAIPSKVRAFACFQVH